MRRARCTKCTQLTWVNIVMIGGEVVAELCADCFPDMPHARNPAPRRGSSSGPNHNDPALDNAVRALEEDR